MSPVNVTGYRRGEPPDEFADALRYSLALEISQHWPRRPRKMKIHIVETAGSADRLVKSHTKAGAERYVRDSIKPTVAARVPTQDELVRALRDGIEIEDATTDPQTSIPEPSQKEPQE